ncbi:putative mediator of RNA polymerase II transcription subunit 26 isoform X4 [Culex quinquefasciatus]|uniref:putative mediator of RNA polymerase II transcription subunit 26 isoform X4 n=1 Tax=Culex quinquefasciatus TaxID=7176 RepID=UPI0018E33D7D|nr:putative mediator of RNA polymerase II transcription subunit 26 isoform X4 [Culex quinquefasciatus]XP_038114571.1 putative mediator of RNA polymerase II transcription subunit 26 isoform X4 [Culex quinquefasciatus]XP_038114572.1 putative mediator of RNA polymerase II transcription subunit 26 isoform X4 [Culex quinquefasciatus]
MATMQRRLVHKQFNSPINLYSQRNIQETLDRELKQLSNGAIGIDFDDPSTTKPPSLAKSAVLQALEEEERQQQSRGKGFLQQSRPSRSRQREPVPGPERARTPCINRDTVLRINRRPVRHRSCDSFWPPQQQHGTARSPSPRGTSTNLGGAEGLKRVAWPPSAEGGDEYEQVQQQQPQQQQQQQYYQQPQQQAPAFQQYQQPAQQQPQPRERIIPIQRTTSHVSPHRTPKSPLGGGHQQPKYPQQQQQQHQPAGRVGSSTVSFSGGRPVLPQQAHPQQQHYQPAPRPVSAPYHQQVQQQQNRYSSPSTASLGSPRSPQIVGGGGHSPRGWAHVQSPVPVYRPAPQHHQQQQQQYVPAPFQTDLNPSAYHRQASAGYGPRKPEQQNQPQYQPQPTQAFQPLVSQQQQQFYQPEPQQQQQLHQHQPEPVPFFTTLRSEPPMSQEPAPVYQTQPVAAIYQGGSNMRGDQKHTGGSQEAE